jgi:hypothetical protein
MNYYCIATKHRLELSHLLAPRRCNLFGHFIATTLSALSNMRQVVCVNPSGIRERAHTGSLERPFEYISDGYASQTFDVRWRWMTMCRVVLLSPLSPHKLLLAGQIENVKRLADVLPCSRSDKETREPGQPGTRACQIGGSWRES